MNDISLPLNRDKFIWKDRDIIWERPSPTTHALSTPAQKKTKPKLGAKPRLVKINGLLAHQASNRIDPTRTTGLRNRWAAEMGRRFTALRRLVWKAIVDEDCFGLGPAYTVFRPTTHALSTPGQKKFDFPLLDQKVGAFMAWIQAQQDEGILELIALPRMGQSLGEPWTNMYVKDSYERGVIRAREQLMSAGYGAPGIGAVEEASLLGLPGMSGVLANPFHVDRLASVYLRAYDGLKGITAAMDMQISAVLAQGLADGDNPIKIAKMLNYVISEVGDGASLGITDKLGRFIPAERRAKMLARTEVIRAHAQAQLQEFKVWGVAGVDVVAEWVTAGFNVCPQCQDKSRQGPYTIEQAWNLIPFHPHCRCCWVAKPVDKTKIYSRQVVDYSNPCHDEQGRFCSTGGGATIKSFLTPETAREFLDGDSQAVRTFTQHSDLWLRNSDGDAKEYAYQVARDNVMLQRALQVEYFKSQNLPEQVDLYRVGPAHGGQGSVVSFWGSKAAAEAYQKRMGVESVYRYSSYLDNVVPSRSGAGELWANINEIRQVD